VLGRLAFAKKDTRCLARIAIVAVIIAALGAGLAACGGGSSDEEIAQAEKRGRHYKTEQERKRRIEKELKELRKRQKQLDHSTAPNTVPVPIESTSSTSTSTSSGGIASCGNELSVGPDTTCPFAENVRYAYESEIGSGSGNVSAYSPANDEDYNMYCTSAPHECSGAISATVYFP
jgi:hypothetical protein